MFICPSRRHCLAVVAARACSPSPLKQQHTVSFCSFYSVMASVAGPGPASTSRLYQQPQPTTNRRRKQLWIIRHGQATHNPRAEAAKAAGCSFEEFLEWMRQDDSLDSPLTELGKWQAQQVLARSSASTTSPSTPDARSEYSYDCYWQRQNIQLMMSSPLSRALETADLAVPPHVVKRRVAYEGWREINGWLRNAQRRSRQELMTLFPHWNFHDYLHSEEDELWTPELEAQSECGERGYQALKWLLTHREEERVVLVAHGGILRYTMAEHPLVTVQDARMKQSTSVENNTQRSVLARFDNGELRRYYLEWENVPPYDDETSSSRQNNHANDAVNNNGEGFESPSKCMIRLTEVDLDHQDKIIPDEDDIVSERIVPFHENEAPPVNEAQS